MREWAGLPPRERSRGMKFEEEAKREHIWLRGFFMGPTGSGKSRASLELASRLFDGQLPITLINTEHGRAKLYADRFKYSLIDMSGDDGSEVDHSPEAFIRAIDLAEQHRPGGVLIVDSGSHEWAGKDGVLQQADGRFGGWKTARPAHQAWVDRLMAYQGHVIVVVRAKMKYEVTEEDVPGRSRPKQTINMLGVGPIQDGDLQYEFNFVARFEQATHEAVFSGHVDPLQGYNSQMIGEDADKVSAMLTAWLSQGDPVEPPEAAEPEAVEKLVVLLLTEGHEQKLIDERFSIQRRENRGALSPAYVAEQTTKAEARIAAKAAEPTAAEEYEAEVAAAESDAQQQQEAEQAATPA